MQTVDAYLELAEKAEKAAEKARDLQAKRLLKSSAQRWRQLAEIVGKAKLRPTSPENEDRPADK